MSEDPWGGRSQTCLCYGRREPPDSMRFFEYLKVEIEFDTATRRVDPHWLELVGGFSVSAFTSAVDRRIAIISARKRSAPVEPAPAAPAGKARRAKGHTAETGSRLLDQTG